MRTSTDPPILSIYLERRRILTSGPHAGKAHIKLQVTFIAREDNKKIWIRRHYKTGVYCEVRDFDKIVDWENKRYQTHVLDARAKLRPIKNKAEEILDKVFTQREFEAHFLAGFEVDALAPHFEQKISELKGARPRPKISSAEKYTTALKSFQDFFGQSVTFNMLTPESLQEYEDDYVSQNRDKKGLKGKKSLTSVGINMRCLRHIFKRVIKKGVVPENLYPFGVNGYVIPEGGDDTKQFMESEEKAAFLNHSFKDGRLSELHDYAVFSFFAFGINLADVARLRKTSVFKEYISIDRQKTKGRKKKMKKHNIPLHPIMKEIIDRRGRKSLIPDDYVFPILDYNMDEEAIFYKIRDFVDNVNSMLAIIAKENNFEIRPTSYTLRHTFSFNIMEMGGTTEQLQDMLAHGSSKTTESYKHGFALSVKKKFSDGLGN